MNLYKEKYIKYKNKYLELIGGANVVTSMPKGYNIIIVETCSAIALKYLDDSEGHVTKNLNSNTIKYLDNNGKLYSKEAILEIIDIETDLLIGVKNAMIGRRLKEKRKEVLKNMENVKNFLKNVETTNIKQDIYNGVAYNDFTRDCGQFYSKNSNNFTSIETISLDEKESKIKETDIKLSDTDKQRFTTDNFKKSINEMYEGKYESTYDVVLEYLILKLTKNKCGKAIVINKTDPNFYSSMVYTVTNETTIINESFETQIKELLIELCREHIYPTQDETTSKPPKTHPKKK